MVAYNPAIPSQWKTPVLDPFAQMQDPNADQSPAVNALKQIYGDAYGIALQLYQLQQVRNQIAQRQAALIRQGADNAYALAQMQAGVTMGLEQAKNLASNVIIAAQDAVAQQGRELDAMRARAQSPSLTNIALGPNAGLGVSNPAPLLRPPSLAAQAVPGGGWGGGGGGGGGGGAYTAWWTWPGGGTGTGGIPMGSAAGNPAAPLWSFGGSGGGPANAPGQNAPAGVPGLPPPPGE